MIYGSANRKIVLATVHLNSQSELRTVKINDIIAERMLTPKTAATHLAALHQRPKFLLRLRSVLS
jgi:hypothetical protein